MTQEIITKERVAGLLPPRKSESNKGDYGKVLVVAGSRGMAGAAILAARSALKAGAGLVTVAVPAGQQPVVASALPEAMTLPLPETASGAIKSDAVEVINGWKNSRGCDIALIGPGLGTEDGVADTISEAVYRLKVPFVIDADGLNAAAQKQNLEFMFSSGVPNIATPHPGELGRLLKKPISREKAERATAAAALAKLTKGVVVLKGHETVVTDGETALLNSTGGPALAKGGTGDVLSGLITGFWAQYVKTQGGFDMKSAIDSAALGVYLHGLCGDIAAEELTERCVLAGELLDYLPRAIKSLR